MNFALPIFSIAAPEMYLLGMAVVVLLVDVLAPVRWRGCMTYYMAQLAVGGVLALSIYQYNVTPEAIVSFSGNYIVDKFALLMKMIICTVSLFTFAYSRYYIQEHKIALGEYFILSLFALLGMLIMASAYSFLSIYLGLELLTLSMYAMVALHKESLAAAEAAMKFFVMGALASGLLLYGISMVYGATGSIFIAQIAHIMPYAHADQNGLVIFGLVFILVGLLFKFGAVPFHMWVPDVYEGAPTSMTMFIASAPKVAAFGVLMRIIVQALPSLQTQWVQVLTIVAVLSLMFGNLLAITQVNIKRMLAYSSIAHMGYMLLGVVAGPYSAEGYSAAMFYVATYAMVAAGAYAVIALLSKQGFEFDQLNDFRGLNARNPWLAFMMLLLMFSMAGIPPTVGFFGKLGLLEALVEAHMVWLAALTLIFAIIGAFYYLRVVMLMYFEEPVAALSASTVKLAPQMTLAIGINGSAALLLGVLPSTLIDLCRLSFT